MSEVKVKKMGGKSARSIKLLGSTAVLGGSLVFGALQAQAAEVAPDVKASIALSALRGEKTVAELAQQYHLEPAQIEQWKQQLLANAQNAFTAPASAATTTAAPEQDSQTEAAADTAAAKTEETAVEAATQTTNELEQVVITARNREEIAQSVPLPVSVIGGKQLDRDRVVNIDDLTRKAPGLTATTPNARRTGVSIRGIGKASGNDNMEAAVGIIVDDVFLTHVGMSYQDYTDLDRVEVVRGPQGTLLGKNTTLGAIHYVSKAPSFTPQGSYELEVGGFGRNQENDAYPGATRAKASYSNAIIDDTLAYRASFFIDKQDGDFRNINEEGGTYQEKNRFGGRLQLLFKPTDTISAKLNLDAATSRENSNTKPFIVDPLTFADGSPRVTSGANGKNTYTSLLARPYFGGYTPVIGSYDEIDIGQGKPLITNNGGVAATIDWDLGPVTLTSISSARKFFFDANNDSEQTKFDINRGGTLVNTKQWSEELRLTSTPGGFLDYQTGIFILHTETASKSRTLYGEDAGAFYSKNGQYTALDTVANRGFLRASLNDVYVTTTTTPETDSKALFGQANWHFTDKATLTTGLRYTYENKTSGASRFVTAHDGSALVSTGNAIADAIRTSTAQTGNVYNVDKGEDINQGSWSWLLNPSYQYNKNLLFYASAASGQKSASVQFSSKGLPQNVDPEKSLDFELGFKSLLLNNSLLLNVNLYQTTVKDYQAVTSIADATSSTGFSSILGNIPEIRARGVEVDGAYSASPYLSFNFGGAYNHAVYTDWKNATCPAEVVPTLANPTCDNTGKQVVGAPKWTGIFGADFHHPWAYGLNFHTFVNNVVRSSQNLESQLSQYGHQAGYSITDLGIGIASSKKDKTELDLVAKNLFDTKYTTSVNPFSNQAPVGYDGIGARRYVGIVLRSYF